MHAVDNFSHAALTCFGDVITLRSSLLTSQPSQVIYSNEMERSLSEGFTLCCLDLSMSLIFVFVGCLHSCIFIRVEQSEEMAEKTFN